MARTKSLSDVIILDIVLQLLLQDGEKAVSFASAAHASGLAAPTLVQRYGSRDAMVKSGVLRGWDRLDAATLVASDDALISAKGGQSFLKMTASCIDIPMLLAVSARDKDLIARATSWRLVVESALKDRLGGGTQGRDAAALMFAAWQGRLLWDIAGGKTFRLGDALRKAADHRAI